LNDTRASVRFCRMMNPALDRRISRLTYAAGILFLASAIAGCLLEFPYLALAPFVLLFAAYTVIDFKMVYFIMLGCVPLSIGIYFSNGLHIDVPSEPMMMALLIIFIVYIAADSSRLNRKFIAHPLTTLLIIEYIWIVISVIYSQNFLLSLKYLLAKTWYITAFFLVTPLIFSSKKDYKKMLWWMAIPTMITIIYTLIHHAKYHFAFDVVTNMMAPFFDNHVEYASLIVIIIPFMWLGIRWHKKGSWQRNFFIAVLMLMFVAIYFAYCRTAWLGVLAAISFYFIIRWRWTKLVLASVAIAISLLIGYLSFQNKYLDFAPNFQKTISYDNLKDELLATVNGTDISSEERLYRWVAATHMWKDHPVNGFGPNNFYSYYKKYTVTSFRTYVSANPEHSTVHDYFLLLLVEQGWVGLILFLLLSAFIFIHAERIYHQTHDKERRLLVLVIILSLVMVYVDNTLSDMMENIKVGPYLYFNMALLILQDLLNKKDLLEPAGNETQVVAE
jgi:O-antigen ligase